MLNPERKAEIGRCMRELVYFFMYRFIMQRQEAALCFYWLKALDFVLVLYFSDLEKWKRELFFWMSFYFDQNPLASLFSTGIFTQYPKC